MKANLFALALLAFPIMEARAAEDMPIWKQVDAWTIRVDRTLGYGCFLHAAFEGGTIFRMGFNQLREGNGYFLLHNESWTSLEIGKEYDIQVQFDALEPWSGAASVKMLWGMKMLALEFTKVDFIDEFMRKQAMVFRYKGRELTRLRLKGSQVAGAELVKCQVAFNEIAKERGSSSKDPFAPAAKSAPKRDPFSY